MIFDFAVLTDLLDHWLKKKGKGDYGMKKIWWLVPTKQETSSIWNCLNEMAFAVDCVSDEIITVV